MGKEWISLKETGQLYLEKVLVTFDLPILFVCCDFENRRYLCLNVDDENMKYVIAEITSQQLMEMLTNVTPMEAVFRKSADGKILIAEYDVENKSICSKVMAADEISGELLPQCGAMFELSNREINDYVDFLRKQIIKIDIESFYGEKKVRINNCSNKMYFEADEMKVVQQFKLMLANAKDRCLYDVNDNEKMIA